MNKQMKRTARVFLVVGFMLGMLFIFSISFAVDKAIPDPHTCEIPDIYQLQSFLQEKGYYAEPNEIDGWCGRETIKAWERYTNNRTAIELMERAGAGR